MIENVPTPLVSFAGTGVAGFFMGMFLRRVLKFLVIVIGSVLGVSGMTLQTIGYLLLSRISLTESYSGLLGPMLFIAFGFGLGFIPTNITALTGTRRGEEGLASGLINTSRQIGGPIGLAILLTIATFETPHQSGCTISNGNGNRIWLRVIGSSTVHRDRNYLCGPTQTAKILSISRQ